MDNTIINMADEAKSFFDRVQDSFGRQMSELVESEVFLETQRMCSLSESTSDLMLDVKNKLSQSRELQLDANARKNQCW